MTATIAILNLVLGAVYTSYGVMTVAEMKRDWRTMGFSHFGAAWITMAFTCGPHHLAHGVHLAFEGRTGGVLDLAYVLIGVPAGATWFLLRVEAFRGGRGDRFVSGTPGWLAAAPAVTLIYTAAFVGSVTYMLGRGPVRFSVTTVPNFLLLGIYVTIGYILVRTQLRNRPGLGGWSVSGLSLAAVFPTCAVMHAVYAAYGMSGLYDYDVHGYVIDWLAVPAALYFLWVVRGLYRDALKDWNRTVEPPAILVG